MTGGPFCAAITGAKQTGTVRSVARVALLRCWLSSCGGPRRTCGASSVLDVRRPVSHPRGMRCGGIKCPPGPGWTNTPFYG